MSHSSVNVIEVLIVAVPETAGSALYGMVDVLSAAGSLWQSFLGEQENHTRFRVRIISLSREPFTCGNGIPVTPHHSIHDDANPAIVILPEFWLAPEESIRGRYPALMDWLRSIHASGCFLYSACSGSIMLAESELLDGCAATSHWGYGELFQRDYPNVSFRPEPNLVLADSHGQIVTAGGTTSWHDLALYIIARHMSPAEAVHIAKVYLLKWHGEGQLPFTPLVKKTLHADTVVRRCEAWLAEHHTDHDVIRKVTELSGLTDRTMKRRFKQSTGVALKDYVQNLRIEQARHLLETTSAPIEDISVQVGYEDVSFFRRLFKRLTGLTPGRYRRLFGPMKEVRLDPNPQVEDVLSGQGQSGLSRV